MAWTLAEFAKIEKDDLRSSVLDTLLWENALSELVPWDTIGKLSTGVIRYQDLPSVGFRKINDTFDESTGTFEQATETIAIMGGYIDTDKVIAKASNTIADARAIQQNMMVKALSYKFNDLFINGSRLSDNESYDGLAKRIDEINTAGYTSQYVDFADTTDKGILRDSATSQLFLDALNTVMHSIAGHKPDCLLMNSKMFLALNSLLRREKLLDTSRDFFDRQISVYSGARLIDVGVKADQTTEIITNTETLGDGTHETSIYAVKFGIGEFLWGIQEYPMEVDDKGLLESKPVYRTEIDWPLGLAMANPRSVARLYGIRADATA